MRYRYRTDEEIKDSGVEWIGKIPKDWTISKIKYIKSLENNSFVDGPFGSNLKSEHFIDNGDVYVIESNFATQGVLNTENLKTITLEHFQTIKRSEVKQGDIVLAKIGAQFGLSSILPKIDKRAVISGNTLKLSINLDKVSNEYIHYQLITIKRKGVLDTIVSTTAQPAVSLGDMNNLNMVLPKKYEQEKIANFLDEKTSQFDLIISKKEELIKKLEEAKKSLISEVVTGKVKVVKTDDGYELVKRSSDEMKDSGVEWLGEIPKEWEIYRSKYLWKKEKRPILDNYDVVTAFRDGEVTLRTNRRTEGYTFAIKETGYQGVLKGDLVISAMDAFAGAMGISDSEGKCSPVYSVCSPIKKLVPDYYKYLLKEMSQKGYILSLAKGIRERSTDFRYSEFSNTTLLYPNFNEQEIISSYINIKLNNIDEFKTKIKLQIEKLKEAKQSLISEAVTGKIEILD